MNSFTADRLLRLPQVLAIVGLSRDSVYRLAREGRFPRPLKLAEKASAWRESEVQAWMASRPRGTGGPARSNTPAVETTAAAREPS
jgi:prophage regulatory protein